MSYKKISTGLLAGLFILAACGLEAPLKEAVDSRAHPVPLEPADNYIRGRVKAPGDGFRVALFAGDGSATDLEVATGDDGGFSITVKGTAEYGLLVAWAAKGPVAYLGITPPVPSQEDVRDPSHTYDLALVHQAQGVLDERTTAWTFMVARVAEGMGRSLSNLPLDGVQELLGLLTGSPSPQQQAFIDLVARLLAEAESGGGTAALFDPVEMALDGEFLEEHELDLDGDGTPESPAQVEQYFKTLLDAAAEGGVIRECPDPSRIKVVMQVDMSEGSRDANCVVIDRFAWAKDLPDKQMFFTGGLHEEASPFCTEGDKADCISQEEKEELDQLLGGWVPNQVPMFDDGTNGDAEAGDSIWSVTFELPRVDPERSPNGGALRIGYKYTWGAPGDGWTNTEEWPGNRRILEMIDVNGDNLVVRRDRFGDETTNKDCANMNKFAAGCLKWDTDLDDDGIPEARESPADRDGDCEADGWPSAGGVAPLTVPCP